MAGGVTTMYSYDGDGRRVKKVVGGNSTIFVYDAEGQLVQERGGTSTDTGMRFVAVDHLGSTRLEMDAAGNPSKCYDYLPFGEELRLNRTMACYSAAPTGGVEFTGKERDAETGLDYFGARYMSAAQGRFTSPDPLGAGAGRLRDPQSWNLYAYARNNPLLYTDALGFNYDVCDADGKNCRTLTDSQYNDYLRSIQGSGIYITPGGTINVTNDNGSVTKIGTASYYNERAENAANFLSASIGLMASNYLSVLGPALGSLRAGIAVARIGLEGAAEAANTRALVAELSLMKPNVTNPKLAEIVEELFQATDRLPSGTAGAVRWESRTGELLSPKGHFQEAGELIRAC